MTSNRLYPYVSRAPLGVKKIIFGGLLPPLFLLDRLGPLKFIVRSSKDGEEVRHTVLIGNEQKCTCKKPYCDHLLFVMTKVLRLSASNPLVWQRSLVDREISHILNTSAGSRGHGVQRYEDTEDQRNSDDRAQDPEVTKCGGDMKRVKRKRLCDGDELCAICQENMKPDDNLTWCAQGCGSNLHYACMKMNAKYKVSNGDEVTCPFCRTPWGAVEASRIDGSSEGRNLTRGRSRELASRVHAGVKCSECRKCPIFGNRYRCLLCCDIDLCKRCFDIGRHRNHPFVWRAVTASPWIPATRGEMTTNRERVPIVSARALREMQRRELLESDMALIAALQERERERRQMIRVIPLHEYLARVLPTSDPSVSSCDKICGDNDAGVISIVPPPGRLEVTVRSVRASSSTHPQISRRPEVANATTPDRETCVVCKLEIESRPNAPGTARGGGRRSRHRHFRDPVHPTEGRKLPCCSSAIHYSCAMGLMLNESYRCPQCGGDIFPGLAPERVQQQRRRRQRRQRRNLSSLAACRTPSIPKESDTLNGLVGINPMLGFDACANGESVPFGRRIREKNDIDVGEENRSFDDGGRTQSRRRRRRDRLATKAASRDLGRRAAFENMQSVSTELRSAKCVSLIRRAVASVVRSSTSVSSKRAISVNLGANVDSKSLEDDSSVASHFPGMENRQFTHILLVCGLPRNAAAIAWAQATSRANGRGRSMRISEHKLIDTLASVCHQRDILPGTLMQRIERWLDSLNSEQSNRATQQKRDSTAFGFVCATTSATDGPRDSSATLPVLNVTARGMAAESSICDTNRSFLSTSIASTVSSRQTDRLSRYRCAKINCASKKQWPRNGESISTPALRICGSSTLAPSTAREGAVQASNQKNTRPMVRLSRRARSNQSSNRTAICMGELCVGPTKRPSW